MSFLQIPDELNFIKGENIEIKLTGEYPELFYAKLIVHNNIFNISNDILAIENGLIYRGLATESGIITVDIEQVWGAEIDPGKDYVCKVVIVEPAEIMTESIKFEPNLEDLTQIEDIIHEPQHIEYDFEGFLTRTLKKNVDNNTVDIIIKSELPQVISIVSSEGILSDKTLTFKNIDVPAYIQFTMPDLNKGLIYGLKLNYLNNNVTLLLPSGVVLRDNWRDDLLIQLELLSELEQLEWSWKYIDNRLQATASPYYQGYQVEWLTSPDISLAGSVFSAPFSDDIQSISLSLGNDKSWIEKTLFLELGSVYKAKNKTIELKLFNTNKVALTPSSLVLSNKGISRIYFELNTHISTDFTGAINITNGSLKKWSDVRLLKSDINIKSGCISDYIEIQTLNKNVGTCEITFTPNHKNIIEQKWVLDKTIVNKIQKDIEFYITSSYKHETIFLSFKPKSHVENSEIMDVIIGNEKFQINVAVGQKTILLKYRKIVNGVNTLNLKIKDRTYSVLVYDDTMPSKILSIGGKLKLNKPAPLNLLMVETSDKTTVINEGQSWLSDIESGAVSFKTVSGQFIFEQEVETNTSKPMMQLRLKDNMVIVETNYVTSQPLSFNLNCNDNIIEGIINPGEKRWFTTLNAGYNSIKLVSSDIQVVNDTINTFIS